VVVVALPSSHPSPRGTKGGTPQPAVNDPVRFHCKMIEWCCEEASAGRRSAGLSDRATGSNWILPTATPCSEFVFPGPAVIWEAGARGCIPLVVKRGSPSFSDTLLGIAAGPASAIRSMPARLEHPRAPAFRTLQGASTVGRHGIADRTFPRASKGNAPQAIRAPEGSSHGPGGRPAGQASADLACYVH